MCVAVLSVRAESGKQVCSKTKRAAYEQNLLCSNLDALYQHSDAITLVVMDSIEYHE